MKEIIKEIRKFTSPKRHVYRLKEFMSTKHEK